MIEKHFRKFLMGKAADCVLLAIEMAKLPDRGHSAGQYMLNAMRYCERAEQYEIAEKIRNWLRLKGFRPVRFVYPNV